MDFILRGVRGSLANPNPFNKHYGANTQCIELRLGSGELFVFDAGTGLQSINRDLPDSGECRLFISHAHADHVLGLSFFKPMYLKDWNVHIYIPSWQPNLLERWFDGTAFPVHFSLLQANISIHLIEAGAELEFKLGDDKKALVRVFSANHPGGGLAFKVFADEEVFLYSGDHEITTDEDVRLQTSGMLQGVTVALVDAAYSRLDYKKGWGHSAWEDWVDLCLEQKVNSLILAHHAQDKDDPSLDALQETLKEYAVQGLHAVVGREGMRCPVGRGAVPVTLPSVWLDGFIDSLNHVKEEGAVWDRLLSGARTLTNAEAGNIYLSEGEEMVFVCAHNDFLFPRDTAHRYAYANLRLLRSPDSIVGQVALSGVSMNLPDVRKLGPDAPCAFNDSLDRKTGYITQSVLAVPVFNHKRDLLGVAELINSLAPDGNTPRPFTENMREEVEMLVSKAAAYLEISRNVRRNISRLMGMVMMRDPAETEAHAQRVGAVASEIYQRWAERRAEPHAARSHYRVRLRLAAMLHDLGKTGIPEEILKTPGKLTDDELEIMRKHAVLGAGLFSAEPQDISDLATEVIHHHHQKWNGQGYPVMPEGKPLAGADIPLSARVTALADVFDALVSPRCYKVPFTWDQAMETLWKESGEHFDPELVECFFEAKDVIALIYERYPG
ncbi:MAG: HD domain-containing protein [Desulfovibrionaceae bacterium]|nr:HD domain-containing protein [Desulfovibrionaceae bacterium]